MIFVFGSNTEGRHGKCAALEALKYHGAIYGRPACLQGNSYAIITKELRNDHPPITLRDINNGVHNFLAFAFDNPGLRFQVTPIGCGLAGFKPEQIGPMFHYIARNVVLPEEFICGS